MNAVNQTFRKHLRLAQDYPLAFVIILFSFVMVIYSGCTSNRLPHALGYLFVVWAGAFITDLVVNINPKPAIGFPIIKPVMRELFFIIICTSLGFIFLFIRFRSNWDTMNPFVKLSLLPLILFTFPIVLAIVYLFRYKYKPSELGVNFRYWYLPLIIHILVGTITLCVAPDRSHWKAAIQESGMINLLFTGFITAALPEEFLRLLLQTRLGVAFRNLGLGFVTATFIWAVMHIPTESHDEKTINWAATALRTCTLMPIGFLWGYITHRTKSLFPSVFIHGLNLWGLQNM